MCLAPSAASDRAVSVIPSGPGYPSIRLVFAALVALPLLACAAPRIVIERPSWDFGTVTNVFELTHDFLIRNAGDATLELTQVLSSCMACLSAVADKRVLPPGEMARIHCHLDLHALSGRVVRAVVLTCNDPGNPSPVLNLFGVSVPAYQITPREVTLDLSQGQSAGQAEIVPLQKLRAPLSGALSDNTNVVASVRPAGADGFLLTVDARRSLPRGHWVANLVVRSQDTNDPPCHVLAIIHYPPDLEVLPAELRLQPEADPQTRILWLKQHGAAPMVLLDAVPSSNRLHCEIEPDPAGPNYKIYVTAWHQEAAQGQTNSVALKLRDQRGQERSIAVSVVVGPTESKGL